ncbi:hydroxyacid dehydrogenase [Mycolicibacterium agri]|uniref:Dehydrogenase n=1 Tax=Mycolicibacterium agri TaxID=36811 RepID=A0A2A7NE21_MYCAG|nr:C-terminal binding protein [Mycolicibacterium agri]PEG42285.1 hydroxyacid dehydrogenase [Mycolicibacterium agri]GFG51133.1 dehydrogenase [Mycolicibacterium agri]
MSGPLVAILGTRYRDFAIEERALGPLGATIVSGPGGTPEDIVDVAKTADVVLAGSRPRFDEAVLASLNCTGIVRYGVGTDSIDLDAARRLGIAVARVSDYGTEAVAFHTVAAAAALLRRIPDADRSIRTGSWGFADLRPLHLPSHLTAGVIGYGRIGRQAAEYLVALGFSVCAHDEYVEIPAGSGVQAMGLDDLLAASDVVLLHAPGNKDGTPLLDRNRLAAMRPGSVLVNTARGSLIDLDALVDGLRAGRPARAALDVFPTEPLDFAVFQGVEDRVLLTPHMAWYTEESEADMRQKAAEEAVRLLRGEPLRDPVVSPQERKALR